ncbi:MAG: glycosyltransferase [Peptococcaceae bacterium]|nr:glycosyltransferase [Peptococcaceae bacterium]
MLQPKVSIVIPIYNVEKYLRQCLDSVVNQTLKEIEIICVNDGSKDSSLAIMQEYAAKDSRVKIIDKENSGYGHSMNCGFAMATGEYVGIVESDDYAELNMFETLYERAKQHNLDVVKSGYYLYYSIPNEKNEKVEIVSKVISNRTICPRNDFKSKMEMVEFFNIKPTIWSAIYRKDFLENNDIKFNETPGASYQDAGFNFKVWACAERIQLVQDAFLHYRQDNENSSVNSKGKVFCVCDEYEEMDRFLNERPQLKAKLECLKNRIKYDTYMWNYDRLGLKFKYIFIERASGEFKSDMENGTLDKEYFEWYKWKDLQKLIEDPVIYHTNNMIGSGHNKTVQLVEQKSPVYKVVRKITYVPRKLYGGYRCYKEHGMFYTLKRVYQKVMRKVRR